MKKVELEEIRTKKCRECGEIVTHCDNCKEPIFEKEAWCDEENLKHICLTCKDV